MSPRTKLYLVLGVAVLFITTATTAVYYVVSYLQGEELNRRAYAQLTAGKWDVAIALYDAASTKKLDRTTLALVYGNRGWCYTKKELDDQAIQDFTRSIQLDPRPVYSVLNRGLAYHRKGEFEKALVDYGTTLSKDPNVTDAYQNRGWIFFDQGEWARAIADFTEAIRCNPFNAQLLVDRGMAYAADNQLDKAIANFDAALRFNPLHGGAYIQRAAAYSRKGDPAKGLADVSEAIAQTPDARQLRWARAYIYLERGVIDKAVDDCDYALIIAPKYELAYLLKGRAALQERNWELVFPNADKALEIVAKLPYAHYLRGRAFTAQGRYDEAIAEFDKTLRLEPANIWALYFRAQNYAYRQEYSRALEELRRILERFPRAEAAHLGMAWFLATCPHDAYRHGEAAVAHALKGCEISHWGTWYGADTLSAAYAEQGDFERAINFANYALTLPGMSPKDRELVELRLARYQNRLALRDVGGAELGRTLFEEAIQAYSRQNYDRAISCLNAVLPPNPGASVSAALFQFFDASHDRTNRPPWALEERATVTNGFYYRGLSFKAKREWDKAIADFSTALRREPESTVALAERGITYRQTGQFERAFHDFDQIIRHKPNDALGYALRADTLQRSHQPDAALEVAAIAIRLDPRLALAYNVRGRVYFDRNDFEKADREFNEAERLEPDQVENALASAYAFEQKRDYRQAALEFREAAARFPRSAEAQNELAWFLASCPDAACRNGPDAVAHAKSACELTKWKNANYLDTLAAAYAEIGDFEQALKHVREAIARLEPQSEYRTEIEGHLVLFQRKEPCRAKR